MDSRSRTSNRDINAAPRTSTSQPRNLPPNAVRQRQQQQRNNAAAAAAPAGHQQPPWRSSLDLVWSYSRSQAFYAGNLGTSPSFTDARWRGPRSAEGALESASNTDDEYDEDEDEDEYGSDVTTGDEGEGASPADVFDNAVRWSSEGSGDRDGLGRHRQRSRSRSRSRDRRTGRPTDRRVRGLRNDENENDARGERSRSRNRSTKDLGYGRAPNSNEQTSLIGAANVRRTTSGKTYGGVENEDAADEARQRDLFCRRRSSAASKRKTSGVSLRSNTPRGTSTFAQTLFNCINALVGVGILSLPLALSYSSLTIGIPLFLCVGLLTSYTGRLLWKVMLLEPRLRTYADIGRYAFGERAQIIVACLFGAELWAVSVALIILFGDSMYALVHSGSAPPPALVAAWPPVAFKVLGFILVLPTVFMPLRLLAPVSVVGIMSTLGILVILLTEGCLKRHSPGSLVDPAISIWPPESPQWTKLPLCFGLIMSGFAAHPVVPALVRDMKEPQHFPRMLNTAYVVATAIYLTMGVAGCLMFGRGVTDEVTRDLTSIREYPQWLTKTAVWLIVVVPLTKFALASRPVMGIIEGVVGVEEQVPVAAAAGSGGKGRRRASGSATAAAASQDHDSEATSNPMDSAYSITDTPTTSHMGPEPRRRFWARQGTRFLLTTAILLTAILLPEFERLMAFLGAALACTTCVVGPVAAHLKVFRHSMSRRRIVADVVLLVVIAVSGIIGTVWAFTPLARR